MFKIIGTVDIGEIVNELNDFPEECWNDTQNYINPKNYSNSTLSKEALITGKNALKDQDRVHLIWQADDDGHNNYWWKDSLWRNKKPIVTCHGRTFFSKTIDTVFAYFASIQYYPERIFLSRLRSGLEIYPHKDGAWGQDFDKNLRYGMSITTNDQCLITVNNHTLNPEPGTVFWFDNCEEHSAVNFGITDRIYLYADVKPLI